MSAMPKPKMTEAEYLERERKAEYKSEFYNGEMFAMSGASFEHNAIKDNLIWTLGNNLHGGPCRTLSADMRVKVSATGLYTYPDIIILCGSPELEDSHGDTLLNPQVVIEILSPSTENYDRGAKFRQYQTVSSLREYILIAQDAPECDQFVRKPDGNWAISAVTGLDGELVFGTVPARVKMTDIYAGVTFPENPSR